jgi:hypothetical protein
MPPSPQTRFGTAPQQYTKKFCTDNSNSEVDGFNQDVHCPILLGHGPEVAPTPKLQHLAPVWRPWRTDLPESRRNTLQSRVMVGASRAFNRIVEMLSRPPKA